MGGALRRLDDRVVGPTAVRPSARAVVLTLLAGFLAAGLPAAYVLVSGGPVAVAAALPVLGLVPAGLLLVARD